MLLLEVGRKVEVGEVQAVERCCTLREARRGVSTPEWNLLELAGEPGPEPQQLVVGAPTWTLLMWPEESLKEPDMERGWWKRMGGS